MEDEHYWKIQVPARLYQYVHQYPANTRVLLQKCYYDSIIFWIPTRKLDICPILSLNLNSTNYTIWNAESYLCPRSSTVSIGVLAWNLWPEKIYSSTWKYIGMCRLRHIPICTYHHHLQPWKSSCASSNPSDCLVWTRTCSWNTGLIRWAIKYTVSLPTRITPGVVSIYRTCSRWSPLSELLGPIHFTAISSLHLIYYRYSNDLWYI